MRLASEICWTLDSLTFTGPNHRPFSKWKSYQHGQWFLVNSINRKQRCKLISHSSELLNWASDDFPVEITNCYKKKSNGWFAWLMGQQEFIVNKWKDLVSEWMKPRNENVKNNRKYDKNMERSLKIGKRFRNSQCLEYDNDFVVLNVQI